MSNHLPAVTYTASGVSIFFGLSVNEIGIIIGAVCAIIGACVAVLSFVMNRHYKEQHLKLARQKMRADAESGD